MTAGTTRLTKRMLAREREREERERKREKAEGGRKRGGRRPTRAERGDRKKENM